MEVSGMGGKWFMGLTMIMDLTGYQLCEEHHHPDVYPLPCSVLQDASPQCPKLVLYDFHGD